MKKRFFSIIVVVMVLGIIYFVAKEDFISQQNREELGWEKKRLTFPIWLERNEIAANAPVTLQDIFAVYEGDFEQIPLDILLDLQKYAAEGDWKGALAAYEDSSLLVDAETFAEICPDYEELFEDYIAESWMKHTEWRNEDHIVYRGDFSGEGKEELLVFAENSTYSSTYIFYLRNNGSGYEIVDYTVWDRQKWSEFVVFANEEEGEQVFYVLSDYQDGFEFTGLTLSKIKISTTTDKENYYIYIKTPQIITKMATTVMPHFSYINYRNRYAYGAKEYLEENIWMLMMLQEEYKIYWWGNEELAGIEKSDEIGKELQEDLEIKFADTGIVTADYNNDGTNDIFIRNSSKQDNKLVIDEEGNYALEPLNLGNFRGVYKAKRMWFVQIGGKIITFQLVQAGTTELVEAFLIEEDKCTPLMTCQIGYAYEIGVLGTAEYWNSKPLTENANELVEEDKEWFSNNCLQGIEEIRSGMEIKECEQEILLVEGLDELLQKELYNLMECKEAQWLPDYSVDTTTDTERFRDQLGEDDEWVAKMCYWAYRWQANDGTENYLVYVDSGGSLGNCFLDWYKKMEDGLEYQATITGLYSAGYDELILYGGQLIFVGEEIDYQTGQTTGYKIVVLGDAGEWENYIVRYETEKENYRCIPVYEEEDASVCDWIWENVPYIVEQVQGEGTRLFEWEEQKFTPEETAIFRNFEWFNDGMEDKYCRTDIDNDGEAEYLIWREYYLSGTYFSEWEVYNGVDNEFRERTISRFANSSMEGTYALMIDFAEFDGEVCMLTVEKINHSQDYLVRARVIREEGIEQKGVWLFRAEMEESISY